MPDVISSGGLSEVMAIGRLAGQVSVAVSPHNLRGPIMNIMSEHVATTLPLIESMERKVAESPLQEEIIHAEHHLIAGAYSLCDQPGSGVALNTDHLALQKISSFYFQL